MRNALYPVGIVDISWRLSGATPPVTRGYELEIAPRQGCQMTLAPCYCIDAGKSRSENAISEMAARIHSKPCKV